MSWLSSAEALRLLGVKPQSLYASVSRGRVRARPDPADPRRSLYHAHDVQRLAELRGGERRRTVVAAQAIRWGDPVLASGISTVSRGRLWYRGRDAVILAGNQDLQQIARLLWDGEGSGEGDGEGDGGSTPRAPVVAVSPTVAQRPVRPVLAAAIEALAGDASVGRPSHGRSPQSLRADAGELLGRLGQALIGCTSQQAGVGPADWHHALAASWARPQAVEPIRQALVLLADHELNPSTFACRVCASTGASLAACLLGAAAALSGPLHGATHVAIQRLVSQSRREGARMTVTRWLAQGGALPGFGHPLYPEGDVRAVALLASIRMPALHEALRDAVWEQAGEHPNVDFALAALAARFRFPAHAPLTLFMLARSVGWLAHAFEQVASGEVIRPRARYAGVPLQPAPAAAATPAPPARRMTRPAR